MSHDCWPALQSYEILTCRPWTQLRMRYRVDTGKPQLNGSAQGVLQCKLSLEPYRAIQYGLAWLQLPGLSSWGSTAWSWAVHITTCSLVRLNLEMSKFHTCIHSHCMDAWYLMNTLSGMDTSCVHWKSSSLKNLMRALMCWSGHCSLLRVSM